MTPEQAKRTRKLFSDIDVALRRLEKEMRVSQHQVEHASGVTACRAAARADSVAGRNSTPGCRSRGFPCDAAGVPCIDRTTMPGDAMLDALDAAGAPCIDPTTIFDFFRTAYDLQTPSSFQFACRPCNVALLLKGVDIPHDGPAFCTKCGKRMEHTK